MKTAEQYYKHWSASNASVTPLNATTVTELVRHAMLDAYRQGCTDAANEIARPPGMCDCYSHVIKVRDSKKLEEM